MEIIEVFEDLGGEILPPKYAKIFPLVAIGGVSILGAVAYFKKKDTVTQDTEMVTPSGVTDYPTVERNADSIISTLEESDKFYSNVTLEAMSKQSQMIQGNFTATNDYINKGLESQRELINKGFSDTNDNIDRVGNKVDYWGNKTYSKLEDMDFKIEAGMKQNDYIISQNRAKK